MNERRGAEKDPTQTIQPGALYAMGLIDEMSHALVEYYRQRLDPKVMAGALEWFDGRLGKEELDKTILAFVEQFPTADVYRKEKTPAEWLAGATDGIANRAVAFEEMMLLWLANANPAFKPFSELFADQSLAAVTRYQQITTGLRDFFSTRPPLGAKKLNLIDMLRGPGPGFAGFAQRPARLHHRTLGRPDRRRSFQAAAGHRRAQGRRHRHLDALSSLRRQRGTAGETFPGMRTRRGEVPSYRSNRPRRASVSARTRNGCRPPCSSPRAPTCGWSSSPATTAATSIAWIRFPTKSFAAWQGTASTLYGSSASGKEARPRRPSSNCAATRMRWPLPIPFTDTTSHTIWAASRPIATCATAPLPTASGWPATWFPTTWASIPAGSSSTRNGSCPAPTAPILPIALKGPISPAMAGWRSRLRIIIMSSPMPRWSFAAATNGPAIPATSITATTAPAFPGTTPLSSTT